MKKAASRIEVAPDHRVRSLAGPQFFNKLGQTDEYVFGRLHIGHVAVVQKEPNALRCSCQLRNQPCVHSQALLRLYTEQPELFSLVEALPDWTQGGAEFIGKADTSAKKAVEKEERFQLRLERAEVGLEELDRWLEDLSRQGIAASVHEDPEYFHSIAVRMADASLPGLSRQLRLLGDLDPAVPDWPEKVLKSVAQFRLAVLSFQKQDLLSPILLSDLQAFLGISMKKKDVLESGEVLNGRWQVYSHVVDSLEGMLEQRKQWLLHETGRWALLLDYAFDGAFTPSFPVGSRVSGRLVYYPSAYPLRVVIDGELDADAGPFVGAAGYSEFEPMLTDFANALGRNPWLASMPALFDKVIPHHKDGSFYLIDTAGMLLPLSISSMEGWRLVGISGGAAMVLFGEWDGDAFRVFSIPGGGWIF